MALLTLTGCAVDLDRRMVVADDVACSLTTKEAQLLEYLVSHRGRAVSQSELLEEVWSYPGSLATRTVYTTVQRLRSKIERVSSQPDHILTVHGEGYRFHGHPPGPGALDVADASVSRVPMYSDGFVGRQREQAEILQRLQHGVLLLTLVGPAGVGKTRLAARVAHEVEAVWVSLAEARDVDRCIQLIADACGVALSPPFTPGDGAMRIAQRLEQRQVTLVLDNLEQVAAEMASVLAGWHARGVQILCTSREAIRVRGEEVFELDLLPVDDAVALFVQRSRGDTASDPCLLDLVEALDRLPLALELAAARTDLFAPAMLLARQAERFRLLRTHRRDVGPRQATLQGALDGSWELLADEERTALAQCATFRGGFSLEAAEAVLRVGDADPLDLVSRLKERSLLMATSSGEPRLRLLQSVRAYALEKRTDPSVYERHAAFYVEEAEVWAEELRGLGRTAGLASLILETENLEVVADGTTPHRVHAVWILDELVQLRGGYARHLERLEDCLEGQTPAVRARLLRLRGQVLEAVGRPDEAVDAYDQSFELAQSVEDDSEMGWALVCLAVNSSRRQQPAESLDHARRARDLAGEDLVLRARALASMAGSRLELGDSVAAHELLNDAMRVGQAANDGRLMRALRHRRSFFSMRSGRFADAAVDLRDALEHARRVGDVRSEAACVSSLGPVSFKLGQLDQTEIYCEVALDLRRRLGDVPGEALALANLGALAADTGRLNEARRRLGQSVQLAQQCQARPCIAYAKLTLCGVELAEGRLAEARAAMRAVADVAKAIGPFRIDGFLKTRRGQIDWMEGELEPAYRWLTRAVEQLVEANHPYWAAVSRCFLAGVAGELGDADEGHALLAESRSFFEGLGNVVSVALVDEIAPVVAGVAVGSASLREPSMPPDESPLCEVQIARVILSGVCR